jgi:glycosyltransferase involved in cell wall biosynthesis
MRVSTGKEAGARRCDRAPRVLIIVENLPVPFDRRVWNEATALVRAGYTVSVICPIGKGFEARYENVEGVHIHRHYMPSEARGKLGYPLEYGVALLSEFALSLQVLFRRGFDVIQACNPPDTIFLIAGFYKVFFRKKFIFDHHDLCPELYEAKFNRRDLLYKVLLKLERWTFRTADAVIATNHSYERIAIERGQVPADRLFVVRSGPDLTRIRRVRPVKALKSNRNYLVAYIGVIGKQEGLSYLIRAINCIVYRLRRTDVHFGIVGDGTELETIKAEATARGVNDFITFTGRVSETRMLEMLSTADVCVNPDEVNEMNDKSTMNKVMEYMALGKPIVQFEMAEGRFSAQEASLYAAPNDPEDLAAKIIELLEDPKRRKAMGTFGMKRVREVLAWDYEVGKLLAAYRFVLGHSPDQSKLESKDHDRWLLCEGAAAFQPTESTRIGGAGLVHGRATQIGTDVDALASAGEGRKVTTHGSGGDFRALVQPHDVV